MKKFLRECWLMFRVIINPARWIRVGGYSKSTDKILKDLMDRGADVEPIQEQVTRIGPFNVWTSNYPYAYGNLYDCKEGHYGLPSRRTVIRLYEYIDEQMYKNLKEKI